MINLLSNRVAAHRGMERRSCSLPVHVITNGQVSRGAGGMAMPDSWRISGIASVTGVPYEVHDRFGAFTEIMAPSAFDATLKSNPAVVCLANHEGLPYAATRSGTLVLSKDPKGLRYTATLDRASPAAQTLRSGIARGDIRESSFAFHTVSDTWSDEFDHRIVHEVSLEKGDVSCVTWGANPYTGDGDSAIAFPSKQANSRVLVTGDICTCCAMCGQGKCDGNCCGECPIGTANADAATGLQNELPVTATVKHSKFDDYAYRIRLTKIREGVADPLGDAQRARRLADARYARRLRELQRRHS